MLRSSSTVRTDATIPAESMTFGAYRRTSSVSTYDSTPSLPIASIKVPKCAWLSLCRSCSTVSSSTWLRPQNLVGPRRVIDRLSYAAQSSAIPRSLLPNALMRGRGKAKGNGAEKVEKQKLRRCGLPVGFNLRTPECCHRVLGSSLHLAARQVFTVTACSFAPSARRKVERVIVCLVAGLLGCFAFALLCLLGLPS